MKLNELPQEVKEWALESYLGNEIGSDEYRDRQPVNGLDAASMFFGYGGANMTAGLKENELEMLKELRTWISAILDDVEKAGDEYATDYIASDMYPGCEKLEPVLTRAFNTMWNADVHPYGYSAEGLLADFKTYGKYK